MTDDAINVSIFDRFTLLHAASGFVSNYLGLTLGGTMLSGVAWELAEDWLKDRFPTAFPHASHDSKANALGDVLGVGLGWLLAELVRGR